MTDKPAYAQLRKMVRMATADMWTAPSIVDERTQKLYAALLAEAGIRDAARQAGGQPAAVPACGSRSLPISTGEVVCCVLATGHTGQCQSATEYPYVSWPNPSNGVWNPAAGLAAPTNHNTETEARDTDVTWSVVFITDSGDAWQEWSKGWHRIEDAVVSGENVARIATVAEVRFVRTTTVRERFNLHQLAAGAES